MDDVVGLPVIIERHGGSGWREFRSDRECDWREWLDGVGGYSKADAFGLRCGRRENCDFFVAFFGFLSDVAARGFHQSAFTLDFLAVGIEGLYAQSDACGSAGVPGVVGFCALVERIYFQDVIVLYVIFEFAEINYSGEFGLKLVRKRA